MHLWALGLRSFAERVSGYLTPGYIRELGSPNGNSQDDITLPVRLSEDKSEINPYGNMYPTHQPYSQQHDLTARRAVTVKYMCCTGWWETWNVRWVTPSTRPLAVAMLCLHSSLEDTGAKRWRPATLYCCNKLCIRFVISICTEFVSD